MNKSYLLFSGIMFVFLTGNPAWAGPFLNSHTGHNKQFNSHSSNKVYSNSPFAQQLNRHRAEFSRTINGHAERYHRQQQSNQTKSHHVRPHKRHSRHGGYNQHRQTHRSHSKQKFSYGRR